MKGENENLYVFDSFRLNILKRQLINDGQIVPLSSKAFNVLKILIAQRGDTVSKDTLMETVWFDTIVEENNLTQQISILRKALGERAGEHRFIVTIPGQGYSFIASVEEIVGDQAESELILQEYSKSSITIDICEDNEESKVNDEIINNFDRSTVKFLKPISASPKVKLALYSSVFILLVAFCLLIYKQNYSSDKTSPKTIAVLPFKSIGGNENREFLGTGMSDSLIAKLGNLQNLTVRPTSSVIKFADQNQDPFAAGRELKADAVLEGTIQQDGDQMRVTVQLLDVQKGNIIWSQSFDEKFSDIFKVQDRISGDITQVLRVKLSDDEQKEIQKHSTESIEAYQAYLRGRFFWNKRSEEGLAKSIGYFEQAIQLDPNYALAYSGLADSYLISVSYRYNQIPREDALLKAKQYILKALEIDSSLAEAHASLAYIKFYLENNKSEAESEFKTAIALNPNYATAHHWYSDFLAMNGRYEESISEIKTAVNLDPLSSIINVTLGERLYITRQYDEAARILNQTIEMDKDFFWSYYFLGLVYEKKGMYNEAIAAFEQSRKLNQKTLSDSEIMLAHALALSGKHEAALKILNNLDSDNNFPQSVGLVYNALGEETQAVNWFKKANGSESKWFINNDPRFDSLKQNEVFQQFTN